MNVTPDRPIRRITLAFVISLLLHGLIMWTPHIKLPDFKPSLPPLTAKLEALPTADRAKPRPKRKPAPPKPVPEAVPQVDPLPSEEALATTDAVAASAPLPTIAASAAAVTDTLSKSEDKETDRPPLPQRAQLTFSIHKGEGGFRIGEVVHTLEIDDGHYVLHSVAQTVGLVRLFKSYELIQYSSGSYSRSGLSPQQFFEERKEKIGSERYTAEMDFSAQVARFSPGGEVPLPPDTQDILSIMYQFPPLAQSEIVTVSVCNGKKIEKYQFEISPNETIDSEIGKLLTVRLHKMHSHNEEGLDIWLAREYRLFPVKIRFYEKGGEIAAEAIITDIRVSEEEGVRKDVVN